VDKLVRNIKTGTFEVVYKIEVWRYTELYTELRTTIKTFES